MRAVCLPRMNAPSDQDTLLGLSGCVVGNMQKRNIETSEAAGKLMDMAALRQGLDIVYHFAVGVGDAVGEVNLVILELELVVEGVAIRLCATDLALEYLLVDEGLLLKIYICYARITLSPVLRPLLESLLGEEVRRHA